MTKELLIQHFNGYPRMGISDIFKYLHQSCFGCEHLCVSYDRALMGIEQEYNSLTAIGDELVTPLDGEYSRVHLSYLGLGLDSRTLAKLLVMSSQKEKQSIQVLEHRLDMAEELVREGEIPLDIDEFIKERRAWSEKGYSAVHHSESYRKEYKPAYRVISNEYIPFLPLFCEIDKKLRSGKLRLAVEGGSASGKSTLGRILEKIYGCRVFHMDDYFLRPEQRTPKRLAEPGGNVDRERFLSEILAPMAEGRPIEYRPYNCSTGELDPVISADITPLTVIEGAYSMHPELCGYYDLSVFLCVSPDTQRQRISKRNPKLADRFFNEWIPMEEAYFDAFNVVNKCDYLLDNGGNEC